LRYFNSGSSYWGYGEYVTGDNDLDISLPALLNLKDEDIKSYGKFILELLKAEESFLELKAGIRAYSQFQDIFGISLQDTETWANRHYCFYESLVYLKESVVSWLDKNILGAKGISIDKKLSMLTTRVRQRQSQGCGTKFAFQIES
jgi:hypothetical protein